MAVRVRPSDLFGALLRTQLAYARRVVCCGTLRESEIHEHARAPMDVVEEVGRLDISMQDEFAVYSGECREERSEVPPHVGYRESLEVVPEVEVPEER